MLWPFIYNSIFDIIDISIHLTSLRLIPKLVIASLTELHKAFIGKHTDVWKYSSDFTILPEVEAFLTFFFQSCKKSKPLMSCDSHPGLIQPSFLPHNQGTSCSSLVPLAFTHFSRSSYLCLLGFFLKEFFFLFFPKKIFMWSLLILCSIYCNFKFFQFFEYWDISSFQLVYNFSKDSLINKE